MKLTTLLLPLALASTSATAHALHISPELKLGPYHGFGLQVGAADAFELQALYFSYANTWYESNHYDETIESYRLGIQHMFGSNQKQGFQAEIGLATYEGTRTRSSGTESKSATGLSLGGAYVYQATNNLGLRAGADINVFDHTKTHIPYDTSINFNLGMIFTF